MISSETRLHSGEGTVGFEMVGDRFVHLASEDFRKAGQDRNRSVTVLVKGSQVWSEPRAISVLSSTFLKGAYLFKLARKAFQINNQASSTDGMRSIPFQDTRARSIRKACSQKCFREH